LDELLEAVYQTPEKSLGNKCDPLDEAVYIILSFQTDLARFTATWAQLTKAYPTWAMLDRASEASIARVLREGGLQRQKARALKRLFAAVKDVAGRLSLDALRDMDTEAAEAVLLRLPGLSWKGARCVLMYSLGRDAFPVDSNVFRVLKRIGVVPRGAVYRRRSLHDKLQELVPPARRRTLHINLVVHGQRTCLPLAPKCGECAARPICAMVGVPRKARRQDEWRRGHEVVDGTLANAR
jgi:endonuclease-3